MNLPTLPDVADMSMAELRAELTAHGYTPEDLAALRNWTEAAELVSSCGLTNSNPRGDPSSNLRQPLHPPRLALHLRARH